MVLQIYYIDVISDLVLIYYTWTIYTNYKRC